VIPSGNRGGVIQFDGISQPNLRVAPDIAYEVGRLQDSNDALLGQVNTINARSRQDYEVNLLTQQNMSKALEIASRGNGNTTGNGNGNGSNNDDSLMTKSDAKQLEEKLEATNKRLGALGEIAKESTNANKLSAAASRDVLASSKKYFPPRSGEKISGGDTGAVSASRTASFFSPSSIRRELFVTAEAERVPTQSKMNEQKPSPLIAKKKERMATVDDEDTDPKLQVRKSIIVMYESSPHRVVEVPDELHQKTTKVAAGYESTMILTDDGKVYSFGQTGTILGRHRGDKIEGEVSMLRILHQPFHCIFSPVSCFSVFLCLSCFSPIYSIRLRSFRESPAMQTTTQKMRRFVACALKLRNALMFHHWLSTSRQHRIATRSRCALAS
jgi:hypothetical protein